MQRLKSLILLGIFVLPVCASVSTYRIDITPKENNDTYEMGLNSPVTFEATGYEKNQGAAVETTAKINKIWWNFDKGILDKVKSGHKSITLKAINPGVSSLTATAMVKNQRCVKTITILVNENQ